MSIDDIIIRKNCIICLDDKLIYAWCNYCYSCRICLSCYTELCCANKQECCPCCRKNIWCTETRPETHPQLTPHHNHNEISININIPQPPDLRLPTVIPRILAPHNNLQDISGHGDLMMSIVTPQVIYNDVPANNSCTQLKYYGIFLLILIIHIIHLILVGISVCMIFTPDRKINIGFAILYGLSIELGLLFIFRFCKKIYNEYNNNNLTTLCCLPYNNFMQAQRQRSRIYQTPTT
jgi:hypothetical protein